MVDSDVKLEKPIFSACGFGNSDDGPLEFIPPVNGGSFVWTKKSGNQ